MNRYWVGGSGNWNTSNTTNWSTSSGGSGGASVPGSGDTAIFDANSGSGNVSIKSNPMVGGFNSTGFTGTFLNFADVSGTVILGRNIRLYIGSNSSATVTSNGYSIDDSYLYGAVTFTDAVSSSATVELSSASQITLKAGTTNSVSVFDWPDVRDGSFIKSDSPGTRATISDSSGANYVDHIEVTDIAFTGGATWYWGTGSVDGGNNTGITSAPAPTTVVNQALFGVVA